MTDRAAALLVACATLAETSDEPPALPQADWSTFREEAGHHLVTALVDRRLAGATWIPDDERHALRAEADQIRRTGLHLTAELVRLSAALAEAGVLAVPFKGPALAAAVYGSVGLRQSADLDLVVVPTDALSAHRVLYEAGFRGGPATPRMLRTWVRYGRSITMARDGVIVDLQWATDLADRGTERFFRRLGGIELGGRTIPMFRDEDLLVLLCIHGSKHLWNHLSWVVDVAELIAGRPNLDWDAVLREAERTGARRRLLVGVSLARRLRSLALPPAVEGQIAADPEVRAIADELWRRMFDEHVARFPFGSLQLRLRDTNRDRLAYALRLALTPTDDDWAWLRLPDRLWWLYPLLRPVRLGSKYGRRALQRARGAAV